MQAWKSLQKDLDSRRYKTNPFEQKYVDLTTSSYAAENTLESESLDLDYLSKSIRARSDIITCQIAYLLKEATSVSNTFDDVAARNNRQRKSASTNDGASTDGDYFVDAGHPIHHQQSDIVDRYDGDQRSLLGDDLLWIQDLIRMLGPTKMEDIATEFFRADSTHIRPVKDPHHKLSPKIDMAPTTYRSTESFLSSKRTEIDKKVQGAEFASCPMQKYLRCIRPFSFEPTTGDKPIEKAITHKPDVDDSYIQDRHDNDASYMQSEDIYETESLKPRLSQKTKGKDDKKSSFQASNSATSEMEFSSDEESVFNTKLSVIPDVFDNVSQSGAMKVLRDLKNKIASQSNKKYPVKSVDQISFKQASTPSKIESLDGQNKVFQMNSLMAAVSQVPKLQEIHSAQLQHDNALTAKNILECDNLNSTLIREDNADDLLLPIPPIPLTSATKNIQKNGLREAISKSALNFIDDVIFTEVLIKMADVVKSQGEGIKVSPVGILDKVRQLGKSNNAFAAPKEPRLALLTPSNIHNIFLEPQSNDLWSPLQFGFGLDKSLHSLLAAIRPNEYPKSFFKEEQSNNILDIDNGEWDRTKSIFSVRALFCGDVDYYAEGDWGTNLASTQQALLEADSDNDQNYLPDYDTSGDILAHGDETHSPRMHYEGRKVISMISSTPANFIDTFQTEDLMMNDSNNVNVTDGEICLRVASKTRNASATLVKSSVLRRNRPLLPVQRIQSILLRNLRLPPLSSIIRLDSIIPRRNVLESYPNLDLKESVSRYSRRVFVSLLFLADDFNRQHMDDTASDPKYNPIDIIFRQMHLSIPSSNTETTNLESASVVRITFK